VRPLGRAAALLACALALAGCPSSRSGGGAPSPSPSPADRGGEIRVAYPWVPATLNPFLRGGDAPGVRELVRPLLPALYRLGPGSARVPWLLDHEPAPADVGGTPFSVRLRLRADASWSDGMPITAADLRFTWRTVMDPRWPIASRDGYDRLTDVVVESPTVARLVFSTPFARWRDLFSAGLGVLPEHALAGKDFSRELARSWPVSGGPFVLASYTPGLEMVFARSPHPWGGAPLLDRLRVLFVPDPTTALQLYRRGEVDVLGPYSAPDFARRATEAGATVSRDLGSSWVGLVLGTKAGPLASVEVRRALARAIDRAGIVEGLVRDEGEIHEDAFVAEGGAGSFSGLTHDPGAADRILDQAGFRRTGGGARHKGGADLAFSIASVVSDDLADRILRAVHTELRARGFEPNLVALDSDELWPDWLLSSRLQAALVRFADPPGGSARAHYHTSGGWNYSSVSDAVLDRALDGADADAKGLVQVGGRVAELLPVLPLYRPRVTAAAGDAVHGVEANASADGMFVSAHRWWREGGASPS
jgi:peptide/nickel transport system substrate-binding protein